MQLFVSDLHLDTDTPERTEAFFRWLRTEAPRCEAIYVLGDLTEAWIGDDDDAPFAARLADALRSATRHCRVLLMRGNRDFLFGPRFARACGVELLDDFASIATAAGRALLCHGDAFCTSDHAYMTMRATLRSEAWQRDFLSQPLASRRAFAQDLRARSRAANANKAENILDVTMEAVCAAVRRHGSELLVHGHTHRPAIHQHDVDGRRFLRCVLGDWNRCGWQLRIDSARPRLECFPLAAA